MDKLFRGAARRTALPLTGRHGRVQGIEPLVQKLIEDLRRKIGDVQAVVLFGSYAKGCQEEGSDIDLLVLTAQITDEDFEVIHQPLNSHTVELTLMSSQRFQKEARQGYPFALSILRTGIILYDDGTIRKLEKYKAKRPNRRFIRSLLASAKKRMARGELRAAATYALNAQRLLENNVDISCNLERLLNEVGPEHLDSQTIQKGIAKVQEKLNERPVPSRDAGSAGGGKGGF